MKNANAVGRNDSPNVLELESFSLLETFSCEELKEKIRQLATSRELRGWTLVRIAVDESAVCLEFERPRNESRREIPH